MTLIKQIFADLSNCKSTKYNQLTVNQRSIISGHLSHLRHLRAILYFGTLSFHYPSTLDSRT